MGINKIILVGRLTRDPELRYSVSGTAMTRFCIAVDRFKKGEVDFINCKAFNKTAEIIGEYCEKGKQVAVEGRLQIGNYEDKDGNKRVSAEVIVDQIQMIGSKGEENGRKVSQSHQEDNEEQDIPF